MNNPDYVVKKIDLKDGKEFSITYKVTDYLTVTSMFKNGSKEEMIFFNTYPEICEQAKKDATKANKAYLSIFFPKETIEDW